jgi:DNA polymerase
MDRREAMLRELNLYPLWVRRDAPVQSGAVTTLGASHEAPLPICESVSSINEPAGAIDQLPLQGEHEIKDDGVDSLREFQLNDHGNHSQNCHDRSLTPVPPLPEVEGYGSSLRAFQLKSAGGSLGALSFQELREKVRDCTLCNLRAGCTQTVFGVGDEQADWLFVGEAPGADEDATGEPFVGHAGRLLDNMLLAIKLERSKVYIANVIKCRPPDDRHPHVGEIAACLPYLKRQIGLVKPKLIVALGKTAASALLNTDATVASLRGRVHDYQGIPLIVSFHPAYLLRSPLEKAKAWQDLCLAVATMKEAQSGGN